MRGLGGVGSLTGNSARFSFNNSYAGALIGAGIGQGGFTIGLGGGYLMTALNFSDSSNASQNAGLGFIYGRYAQGPLWLGAMAAYGGGKINGARSLPGTGLTASGSRGADFGIVQAQAAYDIQLGIVTFEPRANLSYGRRWPGIPVLTAVALPLRPSGRRGSATSELMAQLRSCGARPLLCVSDNGTELTSTQS